MNKTINQTGQNILCVGQEGSHIRNKEVYNLTMEKLLSKLKSYWQNGGVSRHCDPQELWEIMEIDNVPKEKWRSIYKSAYYYFDEYLANQ